MSISPMTISIAVTTIPKTTMAVTTMSISPMSISLAVTTIPKTTMAVTTMPKTTMAVTTMPKTTMAITPVSLGVEGGLGKKDWVLLGGNSQLIVEGVVPDLLHVIPVGHDAVLNGVLQGEDTPLGLGLVTDVGVLLSHADHDTLVTGTANDGGEDSPGGVVSSEAGLAHAGAIVTDKSGNVLVTHLGCFEPVCRRLLEYT